jgi:hypothetical protein
MWKLVPNAASSRMVAKELVVQSSSRGSRSQLRCWIALDMLVTGNKVGYGIRVMHHQATALGDPVLQIPA